LIYNSITTLSIICTNKHNETLDLRFRLFNNDLVYRWIALVQQSQDQHKSIVVNYNRHMTRNELDKLFEKFVEMINVINERYDRHLTAPLNLDDIFYNQTLLNDLHAEYEIYGERTHQFSIDKKDGIDYQADPILHDNMLRLNDSIHNFEKIIQSHKQNLSKHCGALIDWLPTGLHSNLLPQDYLLFSQDSFWGYIYLGYNTLGKNWVSVCMDNDLGVIERNSVRPQRRFAAEFRLNFTVKGDNYAMQNRFYHWIVQNNLIDKIDIASALGEIPLGKLFTYGINDEFFTASDLILDKNLQALWNRQTWSRFTDISDVRFITLGAG
jgi:hypothetical protein